MTDETLATSYNFYTSLTPMQHLMELTDLRHYEDVPSDWMIALTDVRGSTKAIERGKYKDVNNVAAASIAAVLNAVPDVEVPFLFGGDGAALVIPPAYTDTAGQALLGVRRMAQQSFGLDLRVGVVPVQDVLDAGYTLKVAKLRLSEKFQQPVFTGGGISYAEDLIKDPATADTYAVEAEGTPQADFSGYECRWNQIPGKNGEVVSLLIEATTDDLDERTRTYNQLFDMLERIYGDVQERHPIDAQQMRVSFNPQAYRNELAVKSENGNVTRWQMFKLMLWSIFGYLLWSQQEKWQPYKQLVTESTDHEKFDDMLRMTISGTVEQRRTLESYLWEQYSAGKLIYGVHHSQHLLMTCLIFDRFGKHIHFVDGEDGGYAQAAVQLKAQMRQRKASQAQV